MTDPEQVAAEMSQEGTFNFLERLQGRNMPTDTVDVYFDEARGYQLRKLRAEHSKARPDEVAEIDAKIDELLAELQKSRYTFELEAISNEENDRLVALAEESFPVEYEDSVNFQTMQKVSVPKPSEERDALFNTLFLASTIKSVTGPDGEFDDDITPEKVAIMKGSFPLDGLRRLGVVAGNLRMAVDWMDHIQDEDFSPRP